MLKILLKVGGRGVGGVFLNWKWIQGIEYVIPSFCLGSYEACTSVVCNVQLHSVYYYKTYYTFHTQQDFLEYR